MTDDDTKTSLSQAAATTARIDPVPLPDAVAALDPNDDSHWTSGGKPRIEAVADITGKPVTRAEIDAAAPGVTRETAADAPLPTDTTLTADLKSGDGVGEAATGVKPAPDAKAPTLEDLAADIAFLRAQFGWPTKDQA